MQPVLFYSYRIYYFLIIGYFLMSWLPNVRDSSVGAFIGKIVEPYLSPFRKVIPPIGFIDISSLIALIAFRYVYYGIDSIFYYIFKLAS
ncbi:MAG: YggT family protein [Gorillibacterium sp.]|nr:YggT family protein [Gorillibacterium sp.]